MLGGFSKQFGYLCASAAQKNEIPIKVKTEIALYQRVGFNNEEMLGNLPGLLSSELLPKPLPQEVTCTIYTHYYTLLTRVSVEIPY